MRVDREDLFKASESPSGALTELGHARRRRGFDAPGRPEVTPARSA
jgi:hypothetical protein